MGGVLLGWYAQGANQRRGLYAANRTEEMNVAVDDRWSAC